MAESLKERAYGHLFEKLVSGEFSPGSRLSNRALATEMGMSVIPVREAVSQLQSEGLVEHRSGIGSFVPAPSYEELLEIYELRELIESNAAARAAHSAIEIELSEMKACVVEATQLIQQLEQSERLKRNPALLAQWSKMDARFHDNVMLAAGNRRAVEFVRRLRSMSRIFGQRLAHQPVERFQQALVGHRQIMEAIEQGNSEQANRAMADHIRGGWQSLLQFHRRDRLGTMTKP